MMEQRNIRDHDIITIKNISDQDFTFEFDRVSGNPPYTIKTGEIKRFPRYIARHAVKHLIDAILISRKIKTNNQVARDNLASQIVIDEEVFGQDRVETEAEKLQKELDKLNAPSDLELVLARSRIAEKAKEPVKPQETIGTKPHMEEKPKVATVKTDDETFEQLEKERKEGVLEEVNLDEKPKDVELEVDTQAVSTVIDEIKLPTKDQLKEYATTEMGMTWDDKMEKSFAKLSEKELVKELQYPLERIVK